MASVGAAVDVDLALLGLCHLIHSPIREQALVRKDGELCVTCTSNQYKLAGAISRLNCPPQLESTASTETTTAAATFTDFCAPQPFSKKLWPWSARTSVGPTWANRYLISDNDIRRGQWKSRHIACKHWRLCNSLSDVEAMVTDSTQLKEHSARKGVNEAHLFIVFF